MAVLEIREARKSFGALVVTDGVSLTVEEGELHALIGPNGAGKSCLIGEISGELRLDAGEVRFAGERIDTLPVHRRAAAGIKRAYQVPQFFPSLTAAGNVAVAEIARTRTAWQFWRRPPSVKVEGLSDKPSAQLSHGEKRQLELAMAFAGEPRLLLLDEPLAGLGPGEGARMVQLIGTLKGRYSVLLVEHDMQAVFALADRISVLVAGRIIATGSAEQIRSNAEVRAAYLGTHK
jgi:branched-chain amino acid transport system ATP-binding protein